MFHISATELFKPWQQQFKTQIPRHFPVNRANDVIVRISRPATQGFTVQASLNTQQHCHGGVTIPPPDLDEAITFGTQALPKSARLIRISGLSVAAGVTAYAIGHTFHDLMEMPEKFRSLKASKASIAQRIAESGEHPSLQNYYQSSLAVLAKHTTEAKFDVAEKVTLLIASAAMLGVILSEIPSLAFLGTVSGLFAVPGIAVFGAIVVAHAIWSKMGLHRANQNLKTFESGANRSLEEKQAAARMQQANDLDNRFQNKFIACGLGLIFGLTPGALGISALVIGSVSIGLVGYWRSVAVMHDYAHVGSDNQHETGFADLLNKYHAAQSVADNLTADRSSGWSFARGVINAWDTHVRGQSLDTYDLAENVSAKCSQVHREKNLGHAERAVSIPMTFNLRAKNNLSLREMKQDVRELMTRLEGCGMDAYRKWAVALVGDSRLRGALTLIPDTEQSDRYKLSEDGILAAFRGTDQQSAARSLHLMYAHARDVLWDHVATEYAQKAGNTRDILLSQLDLHDTDFAVAAA